MNRKPGSSKRSISVNTTGSHAKKSRTTIRSSISEDDEFSSDEAGYSQCCEEDDDSEESDDSDCSIFSTRRLFLRRQAPLSVQDGGRSGEDTPNEPLGQRMTTSPSTIQDYGYLPDLPDNLLNASFTPSVSLLRSTAPTPDFSNMPSEMPVLPSNDEAAGTSSLREPTSSTPRLSRHHCSVIEDPHTTSIGEHVENIGEQPSQEGSTSTWSTNRSMKTIHFTKTQKLLVLAPSDPLKAFRLLINDTILDLTVRETNLNAARVLQKPGVKENSRITSWKDLTRQELLTFIGLVLHSGTIRLNRLSDYWKKHWLFNIPCFANYMSRNRFMLIMRCLHFSSEPNDEDRLAKIRPIIDHFNNTMNNIYYPGKQLSLDESMILWRGRLQFRQYIKNKRHKYGVKLYVLAEPRGLVLKFEVYAGAGDETSGTGHTQKIVMKLLEDKLDSGHSVYMDNYYNSYDLAIKLLDRQTYCTGTLGKNRKGNPVDLETVTLKKGENKSLFLNGVHIGKWKDKRYVLYISTEHDDEMLEVTNKRGQILVKPSAIINYNNYMSGIDLQDQMLSYYPCERKTLRWYKKIFIHMLQMSLSNAFFLYNQYGVERKMNLYDFRLSILEKLLPNPQQSLPKKTLMTEHQLTKIEKVRLREKKEGNETRLIKEVVRKECKGCREKKKRVATLYECKGCSGSGYCIECFCKEHH